MPIASHVDERNGLFVDVYDGAVSFDEWHDHVAAVVHDPTWRATTKSISDMTHGRLPSLDESERRAMRALFESPAVFVAGRRMAIIDHSLRTAVRTLEQLAVAKLAARAIMFANVATAAVWLGIDDASITSRIERMRRDILEADQR